MGTFCFSCNPRQHPIVGAGADPDRARRRHHLGQPHARRTGGRRRLAAVLEQRRRHLDATDPRQRQHRPRRASSNRGSPSTTTAASTSPGPTTATADRTRPGTPAPPIRPRASNRTCRSPTGAAAATPTSSATTRASPSPARTCWWSGRTRAATAATSTSRGRRGPRGRRRSRRALAVVADRRGAGDGLGLPAVVRRRRGGCEESAADPPSRRSRAGRQGDRAVARAPGVRGARTQAPLRSRSHEGPSRRAEAPDRHAGPLRPREERGRGHRDQGTVARDGRSRPPPHRSDRSLAREFEPARGLRCDVERPGRGVSGRAHQVHRGRSRAAAGRCGPSSIGGRRRSTNG